MKKLISLFGVIVISASLLVGCGGRQVAYDYEEYEQPCYDNQQPNYQDGDYYIFNCGDRYRRVRRDRIVYVSNPVYIPIITDTDRDSIYRSIPRTKSTGSGVTRSTSVPSTGSPSTTYPKSGVTRSTSSGTTPSTSNPTRSTSSSPTRSTSSSPTRSTSGSSTSKPSSSGVSRSTSSKRP